MTYGVHTGVKMAAELIFEGAELTVNRNFLAHERLYASNDSGVNVK